MLPLDLVGALHRAGATPKPDGTPFVRTPHDRGTAHLTRRMLDVCPRGPARGAEAAALMRRTTILALVPLSRRVPLLRNRLAAVRANRHHAPTAHQSRYASAQSSADSSDAARKPASGRSQRMSPGTRRQRESTTHMATPTCGMRNRGRNTTGRASRRTRVEHPAVPPRIRRTMPAACGS